ncbi:MAG: hypothetical protein IJC74_07075 [Clostridia bacterium]|nr:hypothetical protein [Clostridia bacterium]
MKRLFSILLAVTMLISTFAFVSAETTGSVSIINETFNAGTPTHGWGGMFNWSNNSLGTGWAVTPYTYADGGSGKAAGDSALKVGFTQGTTYKNGDTAVSPSNTWLHYGATSANITAITNGFNAGKKMVIEMNVKPEDTYTKRTLQYNATDASGNTSYIQFLIFDTDGNMKTVYANGKGNSTQTIGKYAVGKWYNIAVVISPEIQVVEGDLTCLRNAMELYINGEQIALDGKYCNANAVAITNFHSFRCYNAPVLSNDTPAYNSTTYYDDIKLYMADGYDAEPAKSKVVISDKYAVLNPSSDRVIFAGANSTATAADILADVTSANAVKLFDSNWNEITDTSKVIDGTWYLVETTANNNLHTYTIKKEDGTSVVSHTSSFEGSDVFSKLSSGWDAADVSKIYSYANAGSGKAADNQALLVKYDSSVAYTTTISDSKSIIYAASVGNSGNIGTGTTFVSEVSIKADDYNSVRQVELYGTNGGTGRFIRFDTDGTIGTSYQANAGENVCLKKYGNYELGKWYHIAVEITSGSCWYNLYINGEKVDTLGIPLVAYNGTKNQQYWAAPVDGFKEARIVTMPKYENGVIANSQSYYDDFKLYVGKFDASKVKSSLTASGICAINGTTINVMKNNPTVDELKAGVSGNYTLYNKDWTPFTDSVINGEIYLAETTANGHVIVYTVSAGAVEIYSDDFNSNNNWVNKQKYYVDNSGDNLFAYVNGGSGKNDSAFRITYDKNNTYKIGETVVTEIDHTRSQLTADKMSNLDKLTAGTNFVFEVSLKAEDYNATREITIFGPGSYEFGIPVSFGTDGSLGTARQEYGTNKNIKKLGTYKTGVWYNLAFELTIGSPDYNMYINGEKVLNKGEAKLVMHSTYANNPLSTISEIRLQTTPVNKTVSAFETSTTYFDNLKLYVGSYDANAAKSAITVPEKYTLEGTNLVIGEGVTAGELKTELGGNVEVYDENWNVIANDEVIGGTANVAETVANGTVINYTADSKFRMYSTEFNSASDWGTTVMVPKADGTGATWGSLKDDSVLFSYENAGSGKSGTAMKLTFDAADAEAYVDAAGNPVTQVQSVFKRLLAANMKYTDKIKAGDKLVMEISVKPEDTNSTRMIQLLGSSNNGGSFIYFDENGIMGTMLQANVNKGIKELGKYEPGKWYNIAVEIEIGNEDRAYKLYINGEEQDLSWFHYEKLDTKVPFIPYNAFGGAAWWPASLADVNNIRITAYPKGGLGTATTFVNPVDFVKSETLFDDVKIYIGSFEAEKSASNLTMPEQLAVVDFDIYLNNATVMYSDFAAGSNTVKFYDKSWNEIADTTGAVTADCYMVVTTPSGRVNTFDVCTGNLKISSGDTINYNIAGIYKAFTDNVENGKIILAVYNDDDMLVDCIEAASTETASLTVEDIANKTIRAYLWANGTMTPMDNSIAIELVK